MLEKLSADNQFTRSVKLEVLNREKNAPCLGASHGIATAVVAVVTDRLENFDQQMATDEKLPLLELLLMRIGTTMTSMVLVVSLCLSREMCGPAWHDSPAPPRWHSSLAMRTSSLILNGGAIWFLGF